MRKRDDLRSGVSILVFVELALDEIRNPGERGSSPVSILVFVELALDVYEVHLRAFSGTSFNPCFRGTCS